MPSVTPVLALALALHTLTALASPVSLASVVRQESCSNTDAACWNRNALLFTNQYRASQGRGPLVSGPAPMLANAVAHSRAQSARGDIFHQSLSEAGREVGCGLFVNRENVASFGAAGSFEGKRAARQFLDQWIGSEGHRRNILDANEGDKVVVGVFIGVGRFGGPATYGTQVFATGDSTCGEAPAAAPTAAPTAPPTAEPTAAPTAVPTAAPTKTEATVTFNADEAADEAADDSDDAADAEISKKSDSPSETANADTATTATPVMEATEEEETDAPTATEVPADGPTGTKETGSGGRGRRTPTFNGRSEFLAWFRPASPGRSSAGYNHYNY